MFSNRNNFFVFDFFNTQNVPALDADKVTAQHPKSLGIAGITQCKLMLKLLHDTWLCRIGKNSTI